jgi:hypothetical protein
VFYLVNDETDSDPDEILEDDNFSESDVSESNTSASESDDERSNGAGPSQQNRVRKEKSDWMWRNTENHPTVHHASADSGVCEQLFTKYAANPVFELSLFLDFMNPLFAVISQETNNYAQKQLLNQSRKKRKYADRRFEGAKIGAQKPLFLLR